MISHLAYCVRRVAQSLAALAEQIDWYAMQRSLRRGRRELKRQKAKASVRTPITRNRQLRELSK